MDQSLNRHNNDYRSSSAMSYLTPVESTRSNWLTLVGHQVCLLVQDMYGDGVNELYYIVLGDEDQFCNRWLSSSSSQWRHLRNRQRDILLGDSSQRSHTRGRCTCGLLTLLLQLAMRLTQAKYRLQRSCNCLELETRPCSSHWASILWSI